ncbi:hypothetical protein MAR_031074 [Mya arenaria]|uniref:Uncharacterized protein n=1 Tax=Mya arenaria TaxID=6604 RepID=A0ABY7F3Z5_MYAAR|nr:hypothetical protein MAR_031074 [Mya arenaria]
MPSRWNGTRLEEGTEEGSKATFIRNQAQRLHVQLGQAVSVQFLVQHWLVSPCSTLEERCIGWDSYSSGDLSTSGLLKKVSVIFGHRVFRTSDEDEEDD